MSTALPQAPSQRAVPLLEASSLKKRYTIDSGPLQPTKIVSAVEDVSFSVAPGESFGVVGESGSGKTTLAKLLLALERPESGTVFFEGRDLFALPGRELRRVRRDMQVVFQDPFSSLNPRMTIAEIVEEGLLVHGDPPDKKARQARVARTLDEVGLAAAHAGRYPHEFSGGQRQRVGIARALALEPKLIVADEPVSALDVSIQAQILNLLKDLQQRRKLAYLFISHDLSVVRYLCTRVAVMYLGKIVEIADTDALFSSLQHPYTEALLSAIPVPDPSLARNRSRILLPGDPPSPTDPPSGCRFRTRCRYAVDSCAKNPPPLDEIRPGHQVACPVLPFRQSPSAAALPRRA